MTRRREPPVASLSDRIQLALGRKKHDPVCGMNIRPGDAAATSEQAGKTIYFCAIGCKQEFDADPAKFGF